MASTNEPRVIVGMVDTTIEIEDVGSRDAPKAFALRGADGLVLRHAGRLYHRSPLLDYIRAGSGFSTFHHTVGISGHHCASFTDDLGKEIARLAANDEIKLLPKPNGGILGRLVKSDTTSAMEWVSSLASIRRRNVAGLNDDEVEFWRDRMKSFWGNFLLVDGELFARCHEPLITVTPVGLFMGDYSFYRSHVDRPEIGILGFPKGNGAWVKDTQCFPVDMLDEAEAYAADLNWTMRGPSRIEVFGECVALETVLDDELIRAAGHHVGVAMFALERLKDGPHKIELSNAASAVIDSATRLREQSGSTDDLETALEKLSEVGVGRRPQTEFDQSLRDLNVSTGRVLARREALPISGMALRQRQPGPRAL